LGLRRSGKRGQAQQECDEQTHLFDYILDYL
jgi:hypothetical protein